MKLSTKAIRLLKQIAITEDASLKLSKSNAKAAQELKAEGLAELIPISVGGAWISLTSLGIELGQK